MRESGNGGPQPPPMPPEDALPPGEKGPGSLSVWIAVAILVTLIVGIAPFLVHFWFDMAEWSWDLWGGIADG